MPKTTPSCNAVRRDNGSSESVGESELHGCVRSLRRFWGRKLCSSAKISAVYTTRPSAISIIRTRRSASVSMHEGKTYYLSAWRSTASHARVSQTMWRGSESRDSKRKIRVTTDQTSRGDLQGNNCARVGERKLRNRSDS